MAGRRPVRTWDPAPLPPDIFGRKSPTVRLDKTSTGVVPFFNHVKAGEPKAKPCAECPWRREVWERADLSDEYKSPEARESMWRGVGLSHDGFRGGRIMMSCHLGGAPSLSGEASTYHECAGAAILIQRELLRWRAARNSGHAYNFARGLTRVAVENCSWHHLGLLAADLLTAPWALIRARLHPGVTDPEIAHHELDPPTDAELEAWGDEGKCVVCGSAAAGSLPTCASHTPLPTCASHTPPRDAPLLMRQDQLKPPLPHACDMCPWRVENQTGAPPECAGSEPWYYTPATRAAMWRNWGADGEGLADGIPMFCHRTGPLDGTAGSACQIVPGSKVHECTGGAVLQQRALIRAGETRELAPLRRNAARVIAAHMLGLPRMIGKDWVANGKKATTDVLIRAAHPGILDPAIASEQVPAPTPEELERWRMIRNA